MPSACWRSRSRTRWTRRTRTGCRSAWWRGIRRRSWSTRRRMRLCSSSAAVAAAASGGCCSARSASTSWPAPPARSSSSVPPLTHWSDRTARADGRVDGDLALPRHGPLADRRRRSTAERSSALALIDRSVRSGGVLLERDVVLGPCVEHGGDDAPGLLRFVTADRQGRVAVEHVQQQPTVGGEFGGVEFSRSEEDTSELQARQNLGCRLFLRKKK